MERKHLFNTRLDENVIVTMLAISILAFIILAFKFKNSEPPVSFDIRASKLQAYTGELIQFKTSARNFKSLQWEFGDKKKGESGKTSADHIFDKEGEYTVTLLVNNKHTATVDISISNPPPVINPRLIATFSYPKTAEVGKKISFKDTTEGAYRWEWYFSETGTVDDTSQMPSYVYQTSGPKKVSLRINHDPNWVGTGNLFVDVAPQKPMVNNTEAGGKRRPPFIPTQPTNDPIDYQLNPPKEPIPVQITGVDISNADLEKELRGVADHDPLYTMTYFYKYTCNISNIAVNLNGKTTTFDNLYNRLARLPSTDKIKELHIESQFKDKNKCIYTLTINCYTKRDLFGKKPL